MKMVNAFYKIGSNTFEEFSINGEIYSEVLIQIPTENLENEVIKSFFQKLEKRYSDLFSDYNLRINHGKDSEGEPVFKVAVSQRMGVTETKRLCDFILYLNEQLKNQTKNCLNLDEYVEKYKTKYLDVLSEDSLQRKKEDKTVDDSYRKDSKEKRIILTQSVESIREEIMRDIDTELDMRRLTGKLNEERLEILRRKLMEIEKYDIITD